MDGRTDKAKQGAVDDDTERTAERKPKPPTPPKEVGGRPGPEPTRYGDWEVNGICVDF